MHRSVLFSIVLLLPFLVPAQVDTNAMLQQLAEMPADSNKVFFLLEVGDLWEYSDPDKAISYYREAEQLAEEIGYSFGKGRALQYMGVVLNNNGRYSEAIEINTQATEVYAGIQDSIFMAQALVNTGNGYLYQGAYELALPYYQESAGIFERQNNIPYYHFVLGNIHSIYTYLDDPQRQLEYGERMMALASDSDSLMLGDSYQKYALGLMHTGQYEAAKRHLDTALTIARQINDPISILICNSNLGDLFYLQEEFEQAHQYFDAALEAARGIGDPFYIGQALDDLAKVGLELGRLDEGRRYLQESISIAQAANHLESQVSAYGTLAELEAKAGNYAVSTEHWARHSILRDSLFDQNTRNRIAALDIRYQTAQRQNRIESLEAENEIQGLRLRQRNIIVWALIGGLAALLILLYVLRRNAIQRQKLKEQEIGRLQQERDLVALRSRMEGEQRERLRIAEDLHDDFGSGLSKIGLLSEVVKQEAGRELPTLDKITTASRQLQRKMGEIVWALNTGNDSLSSLVAYLRRYLSEFFEDTAIEPHFEAPAQIPDAALSGEERRNLFLVTKEALHNVLKHSQADQVTVSVQLTGQQLQIDITDNGQGLPPEQLAYGNGLRNMEKRMQAIGGSFEIDSEAGTRVRVGFPV